MNDESAPEGAHETAGGRSSLIIAPGTDNRTPSERVAASALAYVAESIRDIRYDLDPLASDELAELTTAAHAFGSALDTARDRILLRRWV